MEKVNIDKYIGYLKEDNLIGRMKMLEFSIRYHETNSYAKELDVDKVIEIINSLNDSFPYDYITYDYFKYIADLYYDNAYQPLKVFNILYTSNDPKELMYVFNWYLMTKLYKHNSKGDPLKIIKQYDPRLAMYSANYVLNLDKIGLTKNDVQKHEICLYCLRRMLAIHWLNNNENFDDINKMCDNLEETDIKEMLRLRGFDEESIKHFEDRDEFAEQMYEYFYETFTGEYFHGPKIG